MAEVDVRPESVTEFEYDVPCVVEDCDDAAVVIVVLSHSADTGFPSVGSFRCQTHYESKRDEVARWLKTARRCPKCGEPVTGTLEQNMRVIPL